MVRLKFHLLADTVQTHTKTICVDNVDLGHPIFNTRGAQAIATLHLLKRGHSLETRQEFDAALDAIDNCPVNFDWSKTNESTPVTEHPAFQMATRVCAGMTTLFKVLHIELQGKKYNVNFTAEPLHTFRQGHEGYRFGPMKPHITVFMNLIDPEDEVNSLYFPLMTLETRPISSCFSAAAKVLLETETYDVEGHIQSQMDDLFEKTGAGDEGKTKSAQGVQEEFQNTVRLAVCHAAAASSSLYGVSDGIPTTIFRVINTARCAEHNEPVYFECGASYVANEQGMILFCALLNKVWDAFKVVP